MTKGDPHNSFNLTNATYDRAQIAYGYYTMNSSWASKDVYPDEVIVHTSGNAPDGINNTGYYRRVDTLVDDI